MMEYTKNTPIFPVYDINFDWTRFSEGPLPVIFDIYLYRLSNKKFEKEFNNHELIDCNGNSYRIIGKSKLSNYRKFIPFIKKAKLELKRLDKTYSISEVKSIMIEKISYYCSNLPSKEEWIRQIEESNTFEEIFLGNNVC